MSLLKIENIKIINKVDTWQQAVEEAVSPLEKGGYVEERYKEEIINNTYKFGPYYVIAPDIALIHARPDQGVIKTQLAILLLKEPVKFSPEGYDVRLLITLATVDNDSHLGMLRSLGRLLGDEETVSNIIESNSIEHIYSAFSMGQEN